MSSQQGSQPATSYPSRNELTAKQTKHLLKDGGEDQNEKQTDASKERENGTEEKSRVDDDDDDDDGRAYVIKYGSNAKYPLEVGDIVWIVKREYRAPVGPFSIVKAHPDDMFELAKRSDNTVHPELVKGEDLKRDD